MTLAGRENRSQAGPAPAVPQGIHFETAPVPRDTGSQTAPPTTAGPGKQAQALRLVNEAAELRKQGGDALPKAIEKYQSAMALWQAAGDRVREARTLSLIGQTYFEIGNKARALESLECAVAGSHMAADPKWEGMSLHTMGLVYSSLAESQEALDCYSRALPIRRSAKDRFGEALTLNNLGQAYLALARYQEALESLLQSLAIRREVKDALGEIYTINAIGSVYYSLGDYKRAIEYCDQAILLLQATKNQPLEAYTLNDLGFNNWMLGDSKKALEYYARALQMWHAMGNHQGEAHTLNNAGMAYDSTGDREKALDYYGQALKLESETGDRKAEAYTLHNMADALAELGRDAEALDRYRQSLEIKRAIEDRDAQAATLAGIARLSQARGDLDGAKTAIESAIAIIESLRTRVAPLALRASYFGSKSDYYDFYVDLLMTLHNREPGAGWDVASLQASDRARARSLLDSLGAVASEIDRDVDPAAALRLRSLEQQLGDRSTRLTAVLARPHSEQEATTAKQSVEAALTELEGVRAAARSQSLRYAALSDPSPLSIRNLQSLLSGDTMLLEYSLGKERSFLWAVTADGVQSFVLPPGPTIDAAARRVYDLLTARNLMPRSESPLQRRDRLARADADYGPAAQHLSNLVLASLGAGLGIKRLVIVADGGLQYVPFGALPAPLLGKDSGQTDSASNHPSSNSRPYRPLLADHEIVNLPSAFVLATLRQQAAARKPASKTLAVLADPVYQAEDPRVVADVPGGRQSSLSIRSHDGSASAADHSPESLAAPLGRLRFSRDEAQAIAAFVPSDARLVALDFNADKAAAGNATLDQFRIIHYATHSVVDTEHPELSGIALSMVDHNGTARDGYLRLFDVYNLRLRADLVVLSGCQTALGREIRREGLMSLTRGFMYAGAPRVVSSLWSVDDKATAELMKLFYRGMLVDGLTPAAALRAAQQSMWRQQCCRQPYYWAAFSLQGEWQ
jgi:CHAT domain-containing protein/Tfp pilus assembly protein PilF